MGFLAQDMIGDRLHAAILGALYTSERAAAPADRHGEGDRAGANPDGTWSSATFARDGRARSRACSDCARPD
jgi:hypothetical protein